MFRHLNKFNNKNTQLHDFKIHCIAKLPSSNREQIVWSLNKFSFFSFFFEK